jgi:hypothetical protein
MIRFDLRSGCAPESSWRPKCGNREKLDFVFVPSMHRREVRVSLPHHEVRGPGWTASVRAEVLSATGKPIETQTFRISIMGGEIVDRRRAEDDDTCDSENYEPV